MSFVGLLVALVMTLAVLLCAAVSFAMRFSREARERYAAAVRYEAVMKVLIEDAIEDTILPSSYSSMALMRALEAARDNRSMGPARGIVHKALDEKYGFEVSDGHFITAVRAIMAAPAVPESYLRALRAHVPEDSQIALEIDDYFERQAA